MICKKATFVEVAFILYAMNRDDQGRYIWKTKAGQEILVSAMSKSHLKNTIHFIESRKDAYSRNWYDNTIKILKQEYRNKKEEEKSALHELMDLRPIDSSFLDQYFLEICRSNSTFSKLMSKLEDGIPIHYLNKFKNKVPWEVFWNTAKEVRCSKVYIEKVMCEVQFNSTGIIHFPFFNEKMCEDYVEFLNKGPLLVSKKFKFGFWRQHVDLFSEIDWKTFSYHYGDEFTLDFIRSNKDLIDWGTFLKNDKIRLSENTIEEIKEYINWTLVSSNWNLSEPFMNRFKESLNWKVATRHQYKRMSREFVVKMKDYVDWDFLLKETNDWPSSSNYRFSSSGLTRYDSKEKFSSEELLENRKNIDWGHLVQKVWKVDIHNNHSPMDFY